MVIDLFIDNNAWDILFDLRLDLCAELPREEFRVLITREGMFEIPPIPDKAKREFIEATITRCRVQTDGFFGFRDDSLQSDEQRVLGFDEGRLATGDEAAFMHAQTCRRKPRPPASRK